MLVINPKCKICDVIKQDKRLLNRLYKSKYYLKKSGVESLARIHRDYGSSFSFPSLKNHVLKHQFIDAVAYNDAQLARLDKQAENKAVKRLIKAQDAVQAVIDRGAERLENEEITVSTSELLRASQIKMTDDQKAKQNELQMVEMIAFFASGSSKAERVYIEQDPA